MNGNGLSLFSILLIATLLHLFDDILDRPLVRAFRRIGEPDGSQPPHRFSHAHLLNFIQDQPTLFALWTVRNAKDLSKLRDSVSQFELLFRHRVRLFLVIPLRCRSRDAPRRCSSAAILAFFPPRPCWLRDRALPQAALSISPCRGRGSPRRRRRSRCRGEVR